jgi:hypothetical protein
MLHLQARVHLHEVHRIGIEVEDELDGAGPDVAHLFRQRRRVAHDLLAQRRGQHGGIRLLEHLLLVALHAAVAHAEHAGVAVVSRSSCASMWRMFGDVLLQVDVAIAESAARLGVTRWNSSWN